jgi:hypothetical protein
MARRLVVCESNRRHRSLLPSARLARPGFVLILLTGYNSEHGYSL